MQVSSIRPVLKWAGGKSRSLPHILAELPDAIDTYYEPFIGGAAVFFALAERRRFKRAVLNDRNPALIDVYKGIQEDVDAVISVLEGYQHAEEEYYRVRALDPSKLDLFERAARVIFLNKTGYNGLYRENSKGQFNVPFGRYKNPKFCDPKTLKTASEVLRKVRLSIGDFEKVCRKAKATDAVYFDPPYDPVSKTSNFTAYHKEEFGPAEHERLAETFGELAARGVTVVLSNSDTPRTRDLFKAFRVKKIAVSRPINSNSAARGAVSELLVTSRTSRVR